MLKYTHESFCRGTHLTIPTLEFYFKFKTPESNKERWILERDNLGRIKKSSLILDDVELMNERRFF